MNNYNQRVLVMAEGVDQFSIDYPLNPAVPLATTLYAENKTLITTLRDHGTSQASGRSIFRGAVGERRIIRDDLLGAMRALNKIARSLDRTAYPGVREKFYMPRSLSHESLLSAARAFVANATEHQQIFVDRGRPATFLADITALTEAFDEASQDKHSGIQKQSGGTAGADAAARRAVQVMRELDGILTPLIQGNPTVLAAWQTASHIERDPVYPDTEPQTAEAPVAPVSGTTSTPAS